MTQTPVPLTSDGPRCTRTGPEEGHWQGDSGGPTRGPPGPPTGRPFCSAQPVSPSFFCLCAPPPPACLSQWVRPGSCPQCPGYSAHGGPPRMAGSQRLPLRGGPCPVLLPPTSLGPALHSSPCWEQGAEPRPGPCSLPTPSRLLPCPSFPLLRSAEPQVVGSAQACGEMRGWGTRRRRWGLPVRMRGGGGDGGALLSCDRQEPASVPGWRARSNVGQGEPHRLVLRGGIRAPSNPDSLVLLGAVTSVPGLGLRAS